jgi:hypothetical protein
MRRRDLFARDRCDETIARSGHCLDVATRTRVVAERPAQRRDVDGQNAFFDTRVGPHPREERVLGDEVPGLSEKHGQDIVSFRRQAHDRAGTCEPPLGHLQGELAEMKDLAPTHDDFGQS